MLVLLGELIQLIRLISFVKSVKLGTLTLALRYNNNSKIA
jgi:hypothetical protein